MKSPLTQDALSLSNSTFARLTAMTIACGTLAVGCIATPDELAAMDEEVETQDDAFGSGQTVTLAASHSAMMLDVSGVSLNDGAVVHQWTKTGAKNQQWKLVASGDKFELVSVNSGKCLDIAQNNKADGALVQQWTCNHGDNQRFQIKSLSGGKVRLIAAHSAKCVGVVGDNTAKGADFEQRTCHDTDAQRFVLSVAAAPGGGSGVALPFPQASRPYGTRPNHVGQSTINNDVRAYYDYWKTTHVRASNGATSGGGYYVSMQGVGPGGDNSKTSSEAHGYGMIIFALMAGYDAKAKAYFDGMYNMFDKHRSTANSANMSWVISKSESKADDSDSATDGDMDVAYALLLANKQWGSAGTINYLAQAKNTIQNGVKKGDVGPNNRTSLGDWDDNAWNTRASDWMTGHMRAYEAATGDVFWSNLAANTFSVLFSIQKNYAPNTGLMPDFIVGSTPKPAAKNYLDEGTVDFSWNACRFPLRIAADYGHYGTADAKKALVPVMNWITKKTGGDAAKIKAGYMLDGTQQVSYSDASFTAPMIAAATIDPQYQSFLNDGWDTMKDPPADADYYGDTLTMLSMVYVSGNWWKP